MRMLLGLLVTSMAAASLVNDLSFEKLESEPGQKVPPLRVLPLCHPSCVPPQASSSLPCVRDEGERWKVVLFCNGADCAEFSAVIEEVGATPGFDYVRIDCATDANIAVSAPLPAYRAPAPGAVAPLLSSRGLPRRC